MDCLVRYGADVIGRVALDWEAASESLSEAGRTIHGQMVPTAAYAAIRAGCQELRQALHPEVHAQQPPLTLPPGVCMTESFDTYMRRMKAIDAAKALALRLTGPDGTAVPTESVGIEDFSATAEERARLSPDDPLASMEYLLVWVTMLPGGGRP